MGNRVGEKPLAREPISAGSGKKCSRALVNQERHTELLNRFVERIVIRIINVVALDRVGPNEDAFESEFLDYPPGFLDGQFNVLHRDYADGHEAFAIRGAVIIKPIIIGTTQCGGVTS